MHGRCNSSSTLHGLILLGAVAGFVPGSPEGALKDWITSQGGFVAEHVQAEARDGLRGLFVTRDVAKGELLVSVPKSCLICVEDDPQWGLSPRELLTARLVGAVSRGEGTEYVSTLPKEQPLLCDFTDQELDMLQSSHIVDKARGMRPFLHESNKKILPFVTADLETVDWAERMVRSRAMLFERGWIYDQSNSAIPLGPIMAMVPLVDLANHRTRPIEEMEASEYIEPVALTRDETAVNLVAPVDLAAGTEITFPYRNDGNSKLLQDYGFAELIDQDVQLSFESLCLDSLEIGSPLLLGSEAEDKDAIATLCQQLHTRTGGSNSDVDERVVCETLRDCCRKQLQSMASSEQEDREALADLDAGRCNAPTTCTDIGRWRSILAFRIGQKAHLAKLDGVLSDLLTREGGDGDSVAVLTALRAMKGDHGTRSGLKI